MNPRRFSSPSSHASSAARARLDPGSAHLIEEKIHRLSQSEPPEDPVYGMVPGASFVKKGAPFPQLKADNCPGPQPELLPDLGRNRHLPLRRKAALHL